MTATCIYFREGKYHTSALEMNDILLKAGWSSVIEELHDFLDMRYLIPFSRLFSKNGKPSRGYLSFLRSFSLKHAVRSLVTNHGEAAFDIVFAADCCSAVIMTALLERAGMEIPVICVSSSVSTDDLLPGMQPIQVNGSEDVKAAMKEEHHLLVTSPDKVHALISSLSSR